MGAYSVLTPTKRSYVAFVCIQFSMRINSHLSCRKAAMTKFAWESRFSTKSWYMHIHVADNKDLINLRGCAVFLALFYSHIPNVNGATSLDLCLNAAGYVHCCVALLFAQAESHDRCADSFNLEKL